MNYKLRNAISNDINKLIDYKLKTILNFNDNSNEEQQKIITYIISSINNHISDYKIILLNNKVIGCYCSYIKDNYIFIDEIYIEEKYRNLSIGTNLINSEIKNAKQNKISIKLWVYKKNKKAINFYKKLGFIIDIKTEMRYLMKLI